MKIVRDRNSKKLIIHQIDYAKKVVERFGQQMPNLLMYLYLLAINQKRMKVLLNHNKDPIISQL